MPTFVARRLLLALGVLLAVSFGTFAFFATRFGSPLTGNLKPLAPNVGKAAELWWEWLKRLVHGDTSTSLGGTDVGSQTWQSLGHTAALLGLTAVLVVVFSVAIGVVAASRAGSLLDLVLRAFTYIAWAIPAFVLALVLQSILSWAARSYGFRPFVLQGWPGQCNVDNLFIQNCNPNAGSGAQYALAFLRHLTLPALSLAVAFVGVHSRYLRSSLLVALNAPYTTTARAKGLPERIVVLRHALRNSLATFTSAMLLDFGAIFGAALAVDWVFQLGGLGTLFLYEIENASINPYAVQLLLVVTAAMVIFASFLSELAIPWLDPRARLK